MDTPKVKGEITAKVDPTQPNVNEIINALSQQIAAMSVDLAASRIRIVKLEQERDATNG